MYNDQVRAVLGNILATANTRNLKLLFPFPELTVTHRHTNPQSAYPNVTSPMESRLGVCAPLFAAQSEVRSTDQRLQISAIELLDRFLVLVDLVDLVSGPQKRLPQLAVSR